MQGMLWLVWFAAVDGQSWMLLGLYCIDHTDLADLCSPPMNTEDPVWIGGKCSVHWWCELGENHRR